MLGDLKSFAKLHPLTSIALALLVISIILVMFMWGTVAGVSVLGSLIGSFIVTAVFLRMTLTPHR